MDHIYRLCVFLSLFLSAEGVGVLLLYKLSCDLELESLLKGSASLPKDATLDCSYSRQLRYDLSFGMGLSDTITLVFRTLNYIDYECMVEVVADSPEVYLIISILYPSTVSYSCFRFPNAITVKKKNECYDICDTLGGRHKDSSYYVTSVKERFRFRFRSNSSINLDMNAHMYQVTVTAARQIPRSLKCSTKNESTCVIHSSTYCFTSGVVCDGIKNCGVSDWYDERKSECGLPLEKLGFAPVFAVTAAIIFTALAACHLLTRCLPPLANSFFVFNANEDNRLCVDPVFTMPQACSRDIHRIRRMSLVPVFHSSNSSSSDHVDVPTRPDLNTSNQTDDRNDGVRHSHRTSTMRSMTVRLQERLLAVARSRKKLPSLTEPKSKQSQIHDI